MNKKKHELQQNELADAIDQYYEKIKPYISQIILIAVAVSLAFIAVIFWIASSRSINAGQWEEFLDSTRFSDVRGMDEVAKIYPEAPAGQYALIRAADYDYMRGVSNLVGDRDDYKDKVRKAIDRYKQLTNDEYDVSPFLKRRATFALAHCYESLGDFENAREKYQELLDNAPDAPITILAEKGIDRLDNPAVAGIFEKFKQWQPELTGPDEGPLLPERPNISFPSDLPNDLPNDPGDESAESPESTSADVPVTEDSADGADSPIDDSDTSATNPAATESGEPDPGDQPQDSESGDPGKGDDG